MNTYELLTIHSPILTEEQYQEQITRLKDVIARNNGVVGKEDLWGRRRLAYMIGKQREGYYAIVHFDAPPDSLCLAELDRFCKIDEAVLRHLVTRAVLDKSLGTPPEARESEDEDGRSGRGRYGSEADGRGGRYRRDEAPATAEAKPNAPPAEAPPAEAPPATDEAKPTEEPVATQESSATDQPAATEEPQPVDARE